MSQNFECAYVEGKRFKLRVENNQANEPDSGIIIDVRIKHVYEPFTMSCVCQVEVMDSERVPVQRIMKLYDQRFVQSLREEHYIKSYTTDIDREFRDHMATEAGAILLRGLSKHEGFEEKSNNEEASDLENELFLYKQCINMYQTESAAYEALRIKQGGDIPRLFHRVSLSWSSDVLEFDRNDSHAQLEFLQTYGILLEYIPGSTLAQLPDTHPREEWQEICGQAVQVARECGNHGILNEDVRPQNFIVTNLPNPTEVEQNSSYNSSLHTSTTKYRVVMIDFAQCQLRSANDSDSDWGRRKWIQDEEGALGTVMQRLLKRTADFRLVYKPSLDYLPWAPGEDE